MSAVGALVYSFVLVENFVPLISPERIGGSGKVVIRIRSVVSEVLKGGSMIFVGARLGYDVDDRASREAILGIVFAGIYLHFLDAFYGWHHSHICVLRLTVE